jgi:hypothetical protein
MKVEAAAARVGQERIEVNTAPETLGRSTEAAQRSEHKAEPGAFEAFVGRVNDQVNAHESHVQALTDPRRATVLGPEDLLALQGDVYRYSTVVDLTSKLAEQGTQSVQTVIKSGGQ